MAENIHGEPKLADANTSRNSVKGSSNSGVTAAGNPFARILHGREGQRKIPDNLASITSDNICHIKCDVYTTAALR